MIETFEEVTEVERALVIGIGGGGDVVSTISTARLLELFGIEVVLGGVTWIPVPRDMRPGPRSIDELRDVDPIADHIAAVTPECETIDGISLPEAQVAASVHNEVVVLDITEGVDPLREDLDATVTKREIDLVIGIDAGGDALAVGNETGIKSPLADAVGLALLDEVDVSSMLGVIGYGSDGELTHDELDDAISKLAGEDALLGAWGITPDIRQEVEDVLQRVETEASRIPIEAARGDFSDRSIRSGRRQVTASPASPVTYYFEPAAVAERSTLIEPVTSASTLEAAAEALRNRGLTTEFDLERNRLEE